jgi:hypothetical protein
VTSLLDQAKTGSFLEGVALELAAKALAKDGALPVPPSKTAKAGGPWWEEPSNGASSCGPQDICVYILRQNAANPTGGRNKAREGRSLAGHKLLKRLEPAKGIEPPTYGLRNRCSTD